MNGLFLQNAISHARGNGCPTCNESKGEKIIASILANLKLPFKRQAVFKTCVYKRHLPFDFLAKISNNNGFLIEFNGKQHYEPVRWSKNMSDQRMMEIFNLVQTRDEIKKNWAFERRIPILIIPYWQKDKIEEMLNSFIKGVQC